MGRQKTQQKPHLKPTPMQTIKGDMAKKKAADVKKKTPAKKKK